MRPSLLSLLPLALLACTPPPPPPESPPPPAPAASTRTEEAKPEARLPSDVTPQRYALSLEVDPEEERYRGAVEIAAELGRERDVIWLHGRALDIKSAEVVASNGERIAAAWTVENADGLAALRLARPVGPGAATVRITFEAPFNTGLEGHFRVTGGGRRHAVTKFEPISARVAFPCFDEPGFKTPFDITLTVPKGLLALANTRVVEQADTADGRTRVRFAPTEKLPTYLVAWAVGPFDVVEASLPPTAVRKRALPLRGIAVRGRAGELAHAMSRTRGWVEQLEGYFGIEYPYDKLDLIAVPEYPTGAMENAGAIMFREPALLLEEKTASESQRRDLALTVTHEIAHQWFGNLVTMAYWDDLWLNEAFAEWICFRVVHEAAPSAGVDVELLRDIQGAMAADSQASARSIRQPIQSSHDIRNAFDGITYVKGAAVLRMFEAWLGAETFQRGIRAYLAKHRDGNATADDLLSALSTAAGRDMGSPFRSFLVQSGLPRVDAKVVCEGGAARLDLSQTRYLPAGSTAERDRSWQIPIRARYEAGGEVRTASMLLGDREGRLDLPGPGCPAWVMPNQDGAGYYRFRMPAADLGRLAKAKLGPLERLTTAASVRAGFDDGTVPAADVFTALAPFAADESRHVAAVPMGLLSFARTSLLDDALRPRLESFARKLYAPSLRKIGWPPRSGGKEDVETALARAEILGFTALVARDPAVRREAARRGKAYVGHGGDGRIHPDAVPGDLAAIALTVAVQDGDASVFEAVLAALRATEDAPVRATLVRALGSTRDPKLTDRVHALALDPVLRGSEVIGLLGARMADTATREPAWRWLRDHFDETVGRIAAQRKPYVAYLAQGFCDAARADEVQAFFEPRMAAITGGPRTVATVVEGIRLCAARAAAQGASARAFFTGPAGR